MIKIKIKELNRYSNIIWVMELQIVFSFFEWLFPNFYSEYILFCKQTKKKKKQQQQQQTSSLWYILLCPF